MSGYDWEPEHHDAAERAREWDRADQDEARELEAYDRREAHGDKGEITDRAPDGAYLRETFTAPTMHENEAA